jgi:predicted DNA-binding protein
MMPKKGKPEKRVKVAVFLDAEQKRRLDALSQATRVTWSAYIREGVDWVLDRYKKHLKGR